jgi:hypothetical protein
MLANSSTSDIYVGGVFTSVASGTVPANGIAKFDGTNWSAVSNGTTGSVVVMAISGNILYIGGAFSTVGSISASNVAKWDTATQSWGTLSSGCDAYVASFAVAGSNLYIGI